MAFVATRRVEFADTDAAGIMHFSAYFRFMEAAEHAFLRQRGMSVVLPEHDSHISWPRVAAGCDYRGPATFEDLLETEVTVERLGTKSVTFRFLIRRDQTLLAEGHMTSVCCRITPGQPPQSIPIPESIRARLASETVDPAGQSRSPSSPPS